MTLNITTLTASALGFTLALAWTDAAKEVIKSHYPIRDNEAARAKPALLYAAFVTVIVYLVVVTSAKISRSLGNFITSRKGGRGNEGRILSVAERHPGICPPGCGAKYGAARNAGGACVLCGSLPPIVRL